MASERGPEHLWDGMRRFLRVLHEGKIHPHEFGLNACWWMIAYSPELYHAALQRLSRENVQLMDEFATSKWAAVNYEVILSPFIVNFNDEACIEAAREKYGPRLPRLHQAIKARLECADESMQEQS